MEIERIMEKCGHRMAIHSGEDARHASPHGRWISARERYGGYILVISQKFEVNIPPENIEAVYNVGRIQEE